MSTIEDYTNWLHDMHNAPSELECSNCGEYFEDDSPFAVVIEPTHYAYCCDRCFKEDFASNQDLQEWWEENADDRDAAWLEQSC